MLVSISTRPRIRRGSALPLVAVCLSTLLAMTALAIDIGYVLVVRTEMQLAADAAALAGAKRLPTSANVVASAQKYAGLNHDSAGTLLGSSDVVLGRWNTSTYKFASNATPTNAVQVTVKRSRAGGNAIGLFFARTIGIIDAEQFATATAVALDVGGRFIIDDEMIDVDEPWVNPIKAAYPSTPVEHFLTDRNNDFFIDLYNYLPSGNKTITVRTGQIGDEGLFDFTANQGTNLPQFPFTPTSNPSYTDFLKFNVLGSSSPWVWSSAVENQFLPELDGVARFNNPGKYLALVQPDFIHVSPIYKSDINSSDSVGEPASNGVAGAKDERRGLIAFRITGTQNDPRGGSYLPNLIIEIVNPSLIDLNEVVIGTKVRIRLVK